MIINPQTINNTGFTKIEKKTTPADIEPNDGFTPPGNVEKNEKHNLD